MVENLILGIKEYVSLLAFLLFLIFAYLKRKDLIKAKNNKNLIDSIPEKDRIRFAIKTINSDKIKLSSYILGAIVSILVFVLLLTYGSKNANSEKLMDINGIVYLVKEGVPVPLHDASVSVVQYPGFRANTNFEGIFLFENIDYSDIEKLTLIARKGELFSKPFEIRSVPVNKSDVLSIFIYEK